MSYTTPDYGIVVPSPSTRLNQLGSELQQMGISIEEVLKSFDYNGADPNLLASRVAALEAWRTQANTRLTELETKTADTGWNDIPLSVGSGTLKWRAIGDDVEIVWVGTGTFPTGAVTLSTAAIPSLYRASGNRRGSGVLNANSAAALYTGTSGTVGIINSTGGTRTGGEGTVRYMLG